MTFKTKTFLFSSSIAITCFFFVFISDKYAFSSALNLFCSFFLFIVSFFLSYRIYNTNTKKEKAEEEKAPVTIYNTESFRKEFLANLSHELKTPLFSIQGYILTLLEGAMENPETNRRFLKKAAKATDRMTSLINDLDYITKFEVNRVKIEKERFYIEDLFKEIFDSLEDRCKEKSISFSLLSKDRYLLVFADRNKISQAITNLLINSIVYNSNNGKTFVHLKKEKKKVIIKIEDNGPGIEKEHLPRLFERFYRVEKSRDRNRGGSGIGLSIVKHILESHNQKISVDSFIGKGTIFTFTLDHV